MSRILPVNPVDAQSSELRLQSRVNDLERRLATVENMGLLAPPSYYARCTDASTAAAVGTGVRLATAANNGYRNSNYFKGWEVGNVTTIEVQKTGWVVIHATLFIVNASGAGVPVEGGLYLNGVQFHGARATTTTNSQASVALVAMRYFNADDGITMCCTSGGEGYNGPDGRYTSFYCQYVGL